MVELYNYQGNSIEPSSYTYDGEFIKTIQGKYNCGITEISSPTTTNIGAQSPQGFAISNDYMVQMYSGTTGKCAVVDISDNSVVGTMDSNCGHGNSVDFFNAYYDESDILPIALVSDGLSRKAYVARITASAVTVLKELVFPQEHSGYYVSTMLDKENLIIYTVGYYANSYTSDTNNHMVISAWDYSDLTDNGDETYTPAFIKSFDLPFMTTLQGPTFYNGRLYIVSSKAPSSADTKIYVIDPYGERITNVLEQFPTAVKNNECEAIYFYNNIAYIKYGNQPLYYLEFNT